MSKDEPQLPQMCFKTYDVSPWPSLILENDISLTPFELPIFSERIFTTPLMHTKYLTTGYHVSGENFTPQGQL